MQPNGLTDYREIDENSNYILSSLISVNKLCHLNDTGAGMNVS